MLGVITLFGEYSNPWIVLITFVHIGGFMLVVFDCLRHRRQADSALLWIFISWSLTLVGSLLYLYFGIDRLPSQSHRKNQKDREFEAQRESRANNELPLAYWKHMHDATAQEPDTEPDRSIHRSINNIAPQHPLLRGNRIEPLITGDEAYPAMLEAIKAAKHHIHLESFIIAADETGTQFLDLLKTKAEEGVIVRVLYDRFGSTYANLSGFFRHYQHIPNLRVVGFSQANPLKRQFGINLRNHRKILVTDGRHAFTGGTNIARENTTHDGKQPIQDYHFKVEGPIVQELQFTFLEDWYSMTSEDPARLLTGEYFPEIQPAGNAHICIMNSGPTNPETPITDALFLAITQARKQIIAVTPYFVPTDDILHAMKSAARRGVDVRLIVPRENNHFYAALACNALYEEMLQSGIQIFERAPPFSHAKAIMVDSLFAIIGSANIDVRSLRLNFETCLAVYDENFANIVKSVVLSDQAHSSAIDLQAWKQRPFGRKLLENTASLLTPML
jgi:cardiolipin synthase